MSWLLVAIVLGALAASQIVIGAPTTGRRYRPHTVSGTNDYFPEYGIDTKTIKKVMEEANITPEAVNHYVAKAATIDEKLQRLYDLEQQSKDLARQKGDENLRELDPGIVIRRRATPIQYNTFE